MAKKLLVAGSIALLVMGITIQGWAKERIKFASHFKGSPAIMLPAFAAIEKGFWRELAVEVDWFPFASAGTMVRAVAAGEIDMGTHGMGSVILAVAAGVPEVIVADYKSHLQFLLWVLIDSPLREPKDLKGTKIGITRKGTTPHQLAVVALQALGIEKVKWVALGGGGPLLAAFKARHVDSISLSYDDMAPYIARGEVREMLNLNDYAPLGTTAQVIFATRKIIQEEPEAVRRIVRGFLRATGFVMENRDWTVAKIRAEFGMNEAGASTLFPAIRYGRDGRIDTKKIKETIDFLVQTSLLAKEKAPALDKVYTDKFGE